MDNRRDGAERVFEYCVGVALGKASYGISGDDDLIRRVDRIEGEILNRNIHGHPYADERCDAEISKDRIEFCAVKRGETMKTGQKDVALVDGYLGDDLGGLASAQERMVYALHVSKQASIGIGTPSVGAALRGAVDDHDAGAACAQNEVGHSLDHSHLRGFRERRKAGQVADDAPLALVDHERASLGGEEGIQVEGHRGKLPDGE